MPPPFYPTPAPIAFTALDKVGINRIKSFAFSSLVGAIAGYVGDSLLGLMVFPV